MADMVRRCTPARDTPSYGRTTGGSSNYGEEFRTDIVGDYFPQAFDDIMAGVDHLIDQGIVDEEQMGAFGWSAGGHWSNWILTHTDRFKGHQLRSGHLQLGVHVGAERRPSGIAATTWATGTIGRTMTPSGISHP